MGKPDEIKGGLREMSILIFFGALSIMAGVSETATEMKKRHDIKKAKEAKRRADIARYRRPIVHF